MSRNQANPPAVFAAADILVVPGRGGSCERHWQTHFENRHRNAHRVEQPDWDAPDLDAWARRIAAAAGQNGGRTLVVAHSFGCLALARAVQTYDADIGGALLVAPAAPERFGIAMAVIAHRLRVPSLLLASSNDPWLHSGKARELATHWGSRYLNLGLVGHINVASGFGPWPACDQFAEIVWREAMSGEPPVLGLAEPRGAVKAAYAA